MIIDKIKVGRCVKNLTQLPISPMFIPKAKDEYTRYIIWNKKRDNLVGEFSFWNDGKITDIFFNSTIRGKKTISDAILSVKNFVIKEAQKRNLDKVKIQISANDKKELARTKSILKKLGEVLQEGNKSQDNFTVLSK